MGLNSCIYTTEIMHHRFIPDEHKFSYKFFSFYLDLDEINEVCRKLYLINYNRSNVYSLYDSDHVPDSKTAIKDHIIGYLNRNGINLDGGKIMLLTYLRTFGHLFNPVSFYYCFDFEGNPVCVLPEIGNTFGEIKMFAVSGRKSSNGLFKSEEQKLFYISPFNRLDDYLHFRLGIPDNQLSVVVKTVRDEKTVIVASMQGHREELTDRNLVKLTLRFPFVTVKVISLIYWHAFLLWFKRVPYEEKTSNPHLQKEVYRAWSSIRQ